jgi:hypothetical protein
MSAATVTDAEQYVLDALGALEDRVERLDAEVASLDEKFVRLLAALVDYAKVIERIVDELVEREIDASELEPAKARS